MVTRWVINGATATFNPDWRDGDTDWQYDSRTTEIDPLGGSKTVLQTEPVRSGKRTLLFRQQTKAVKDAWEAAYKAQAPVTMSDDRGANFSAVISSFRTKRTPKVQDMDRYEIQMTIMLR